MEDGVCCLASVEVDPIGIWNIQHLRVWRLEKLKWTLEKERRVKQVLGKHAHGRGLFCTVRAVTNGIALLRSSSSMLHFVVDLRTFFVKDMFEYKDRAFPMQMPWPPAFSAAIVSAEQSAPSTVGNANEAQIQKDNIPNNHDLQAQV